MPALQRFSPTPRRVGVAPALDVAGSRPVLTDSSPRGVFDTFDPEGVGDMIQGFAAGMDTHVVRIMNAPDARARRNAIDEAVKRLKLYSVATDRILGLPDRSTVVLTRKQLEKMVALLPSG